ncbi:MAG: glycoside hydrolase family 31 [Acidobacteria bacterium]|nr:glycoside hydrolase family 31 [Acidobacteriota bacterium]
MVDVLDHDPAGDRNPYESVPWSRNPLLPTSLDEVAIGVRTHEDFDSVAIEWRSEHQATRVALGKTGDVWSATFGPFDVSGEYRFVASRSSSEPNTVSEWFLLPVSRWESVALSSVVGDSDRLYVVGDGAVLTLSSLGADVVDWNLTVRSVDTDSGTSAKCGEWTATVDNGRLTMSREGMSLIISVEILRADGLLTGWRLSWELDPSERIFGTGERFDSFDQRGRTPDVRVYEQYKQQGDRTYFPLPWLWSTRGYGLAIHGQSRIAYDLGSANPNLASVTIPGTSEASGRWYFGEPKSMLRAYAKDVGAPTPLPLWAYGPWMSGNEWDSDRSVREVVDRTRAEGIPSTVIVIEAWSDEVTFYLFNGTEYDPVDGGDAVSTDNMRHGEQWPDPKGLVDWLHQQGIRVLLWQIPLLKNVQGHVQHDADMRHVDQAQLSVRTTGGDPYFNRGWWFPGSQVIDFTNPEARTWWFNKRSYLLDEVGIDGFKTDGGEHLWGDDVITYAGEVGDEAANAYPAHYIEAYHAFLRGHGHSQPVTFSRAGFTGAQTYPAHWAGDEDSTWDAFRASLTAGLSAAASGIAFWGWDLAGFSGELPTAELYMRSTAMAAFCPIMQYHSEHNEHRLPSADRTPWNVASVTEAPEVVEVYRFYARLRMNLVPYLFGLGIEAARDCLPIIRPLAVEFPDDAQAGGIDDQFLLGPNVLVAPVVTPGATERRVYLPAGTWFNFWNGERVGDGWVDVSVETHLLPVFVRAGSCIPLWMPESIELGTDVALPDRDSGRLVLMAFPGSARTTGVDPVTSSEWTVELLAEGQTLKVSAEGMPSNTVLWIREQGSSEGRRRDYELGLAAGTSNITIDLTFDVS